MTTMTHLSVFREKLVKIIIDVLHRLSRSRLNCTQECFDRPSTDRYINRVTVFLDTVDYTFAARGASREKKNRRIYCYDTACD